MLKGESDELNYGAQPTARLPKEARISNADLDNSDTLRVVLRLLGEALAGLDQWHAFDLSEKEKLNLREQIKAHQLAADIIEPLYDTVQSAVDRIDRKYRKANNG